MRERKREKKKETDGGREKRRAPWWTDGSGVLRPVTRIYNGSGSAVVRCG
ncbi:hypothetical protein A2U01_0087973 [Trifolium medium]|uniref:Uncharacterized protein n=1 Tax=Trifolium medium TaxID=97028 RepID=A0A392U3U8_9FABA|nr:hypothetical protein [Trifolium medium]